MSKERVSRKDDTATIVHASYRHIMPAQILGLAIVAINGFIDSLITGKFLGTEQLAAIGLFGPIATVIGITGVVTMGIQVLCSHEIGAGRKDRVVSLFSTGVILLSVFSLLVTALSLALPGPLSSVLGARGQTAVMLTAYIRGYAPGIIGQVLSAVLIVFLPFNNDIRRSYFGIGVMIVSNVVMDVLNVLVFHWDTFGMGLATSISYLASTAIMLAGFLDKEKTFHLRFYSLSFGSIPQAMLNGLPYLMFTVGCTVKSYILNMTLLNNIGSSAVAVMNVQNSIISILGAIPQGCAGALLTLASMYYGEEDRKSLLTVTRYALRIGLLISVVSVVLLMSCSSLVSSLFFSPAEEAWGLARQMLLLFPNWLILNLVFCVITKIYQCQGKKILINVLSFAETLGAGLIAAGLCLLIGSDGVWISFTISDLLSLAVIGIIVFIWAKKITFRLTDWMRLSPDFGASEENCMEFSVHSIEEVVILSARVRDFCLTRNVDKHHSMLARLSIEEMAGNVIAHGFKPGEKHSVDVRIVTGSVLTIRIRDDCRAFDPGKYMEQFSDKDPTRNVGLRMIISMAREVTYQNNAGINTLLIKV